MTDLLSLMKEQAPGRAALGIASVLCLVLGAAQMDGQTTNTTTVSTPQTIRLWNGPAPDALGETPADIPILDVWLPAQNPTKTGVVVCPGGGYRMLSLDNEGSSIAKWLNARGIAAFVLHYRVTPYRYPVPMQDGARAMRLVRNRATSFGINPEHLGVWGFSAGGHLASTLMTGFDNGLPNSSDATETASDRPDFGILSYPVITMKPGVTHSGSHTLLLGDPADPELERKMSSELQVRNDSPPAFLFFTTDDATVPVMNGVLFYEAYVSKKLSIEMHIFENGAHGAGLGRNKVALEKWPDLLAIWMQRHGWMERVVDVPSTSPAGNNDPVE